MDLTKSEIERAGCLRRLFKKRFLLRSRNEKWFQTITSNRHELQRVCDGFGIQLEINETLGVTYLKTADPEIEEALDFQIGNKRTLSTIASLLIFHLRSVRLQFFLNPNNQDAPLIQASEIREFLSHFQNFKIDRQFETAYRKAIDEFTNLEILIETKTGTDLYEISPICELLLPSDQILEYQTKLQNYFAHPQLQIIENSPNREA